MLKKAALQQFGENTTLLAQKTINGK